MSKTNPQINFSDVYKQYCTNYKVIHNHDNQNNISVNHPFIFLNYLSKPTYENTSVLNSFEKGFLFFNQLKLKTEHAYLCFEFEFNPLGYNKKLYLNKIVNILFELYNNLNQGGYLNEQGYQRIIANAIMEILTRISLSHSHLYLNSTNRKKLSKWFNIKEPVLSFEMKKRPEDKWLARFYQEYLEGVFIEKREYSFSSFKALFEGKHLENKINWIDNKASLYYFIQLCRILLIYIYTHNTPF